MLPRRLLDKSNISSTAIFPMEDGIVPVSLLPASFNTLRDWNLPRPRSSGIDPVNPIDWLDMSSNSRLAKDSAKSGSCPEKASLDEMSNCRSCGRLSNDSGRLPERELCDMLN